MERNQTKKKKITKRAQRLCRERWLLWGPVLVWMGIIFAFSSMQGGDGTYPMSLFLMLQRKGAHVFEFFVLTLLVWRLFRAFIPQKRKQRALWLAVFVAMIYAVLDEVHQLFVWGRTGKATDVLIDSIGIGMAACLIMWLQYHKRGKKILTKIVGVLQ